MRRLGNEERALWAKVAATVKPLRRSTVPELPVERHSSATPPKRIKAQRPQKEHAPAPAPQPQVSGGLDAGWDRRLGRGLVAPDVIVDLHGYNLATAHAVLDRKIEESIAAGHRLILLITGRPPRGDHPPVARGVIRASIQDWLEASPHASGIAAVRSAHPRHGGVGALYLVLRRRRSGY